MRRRWPRVLAGVLLALALAAGAGFGIGSARLHDSLPLVRGELPIAGLAQPVRVERDALGVPVIRGRSRADVARATGFVHAQERFFQMDLLRRRAAGELAALVGKAALPADREVRVLQLRSVARRAVVALGPEERALLAAYTEGVNAGLAGLRAAPFEYLLLRTGPASWQPEDSLLCALTMYLTLQGELPEQESMLGLMHDLLPPALFEFLAPRGTEWDAPLEGVPFTQPAVPGPEVVDLRRQPPSAPKPAASRVTPAEPALAWIEPLAGEDRASLGSNNWAVDGAHGATGAAILANDMHLGLSVPNIWYRASLVFAEDGAERRVTGVTLPGAPFVVVGSNGRVAWGFTNSQGDWADLVVLDPDPNDTDAYWTPSGSHRFEHATETIQVKGGADEHVLVLNTLWGPVIDKDHAGRRRALAWVALREGGLNASLLRMEEVRSLDEAQALAPECGIPNQNLVVADAAGRIGWTIIGRIPRRFGHDGRLPVSWSDGTSGWDGWLPAAEYPRIVDPPGGRIQTANARVVDGEDLRKLGFGGYDLGARQRQIRDDLLAIDKATEADMLRVQLDDRAVFLARWQQLLLELLTPQATAGRPLRAEARQLVEGWGARASVESVGYRIVRSFRMQVAADVFAPLLAPCTAADPKLDYLGTRANRGHRQWEGPLWALVTQRPAHLLDPAWASWEARLLASLDAVLEELTGDGRRLAERSWGERNTTRIQHPLARALPLLAGWLDMPPHALPGDSHMPRVQSPQAGASERLAVSPGHEERGYFHMPTGESGNPRSPHYADGHLAWERGERTPFLPGPAVEVLTLVPAPADRVFVNGRVWTGDPGRPAAQALAVRGGTLLAVGSNAEIRALAGSGTEVVDLAGRRVVPGFIDAHLHLLGGGIALESLRLDDAETAAALLERVRAWAAAHPTDRWISGEGWTYAAFAGGMPTAAQLDAAVADRPAWLVSYDGHTGWANSAALRLAGVTRETKDPASGTIVRAPSGEPTGVLKEAAQEIVGRLLPKLSAQEEERAFARAIAQAAAWGLTSVQQAGIGEEDLETLARVLARTPALRVYAALRMDRAPGPDRLARQQALRGQYATERLHIGAVKGFVDGVVEAETAAMFDPYPGGGTGIAEWTQEELDRAVAAYDRAGWQVMLHAIGDRGIDMALTAFERAAAANGTSDRRHRVEHVEVPRTGDLPRFKAGGIVASTQATFPYPNANHLGVYLPTLGPERAHRALAFASIDAAGAVQAFGSDWPVFSADVLRAIACAVTRTTLQGTPPGGWEPAQRLSVEAALRHYTADAAWAEHAEAEKGTLAPGKAADFVVLSQDLLAVAPEKVQDTHVLLTVLAGRDTYRAKGF